MNTSRFVLAIAMVILHLPKPTFAEDPVLPSVSFVSPDGRYCVQLDVIDGLLRFVIKDMKTERIDDSVQSTGPVYLHWAKNSKAFVTVEHTSKGSYGRVVYLADDHWLSVQVPPRFEGKMDCSVINLQLESDRVHYKFAVRKLSADWAPIGYSFCDLDVGLETGKVSNVKWASASEAEWTNAPGPDEPVCVPRMAQERQHDLCK
jgi:hypothetical protein